MTKQGLVQFDQEEAVLITGDNVKDLTGKDVGYNKRNYQLKEPKFLPAGLHTVTFTTQQHGTQSPQFQLSNFVLTQTELPSHFAVKSSSKNIETKTVDVTFYVENGKAVDFVVIAAAYDGEVMQAVDFKTVEKMTNASNQTVTLNLPGMTVNSKVKLYVWKSIGGAGALVPIFEKGDVQ
ncbi:MAG: hypothetical protein RSA27_01375 [Oscillospiraceae bacterium]